MLIRRRDLEAVARGEVTLAFRRWKRPTVKTGGTLRTVVGVLSIGAVERVSQDEIDEGQARSAGFASLEALLAELGRHGSGELYRIELQLAGPDPREVLRRRTRLSDRERSEIDLRLARFDKASPRGPWTRTLLDLIHRQPETRAADLAALAGFEVRWLKSKVRKLKELGLTESLGVGYRISPRGEFYLGGSDEDSK